MIMNAVLYKNCCGCYLILEYYHYNMSIITSSLYVGNMLRANRCYKCLLYIYIIIRYY